MSERISYDKQELFDHMAQDHGLTLLETEMNDIAHIIEKPLQARVEELEEWAILRDNEQGRKIKKIVDENGSLQARVKELEGSEKQSLIVGDFRIARIKELEARVEELESVPKYHHPDCNWWKWDWRYSWDATDCNCDDVAVPPEPPK